MSQSKSRRGLALGVAILTIAAIAVVGCSAPPPEQTFPILGKVVVTADLVRGATKPTGAICAYNSQFARGEDIVARIKILDPKTEKYLTDKEMKSVKLMLKDGTNATGKYGGHPGGNNTPTDFFWTAAWVIPDNYPTGQSGWWVEVETNDGRKGRFDPPNVAAAALTIIERPAGK